MSAPANPRFENFSRYFEAEHTVIAKAIATKFQSYAKKGLIARDQVVYLYRVLNNPIRFGVTNFDRKLIRCGTMLIRMVLFEGLLPKNLERATPIDPEDLDYILADLLISARIVVRTAITKAFHRACVKAGVTPDSVMDLLDQDHYSFTYGPYFHDVLYWAKYELPS